MKTRDLIFKIENISFDEALEYLVKIAQKKGLPAGRQGEKTFVVTLNTEMVMLARSDTRYEKILKSADLALNDSIGLVFARKLFGRSSKGRVHGSDLVEGLAREATKKPITVGFFGGKENVAQR